MKIKQRFINILNALKESINRFPISILLSTILAITLIYMQEKGMGLSTQTIENLRKFSMTIGLSIILFACIDLIKESLDIEKHKLALLYALGLGISLIFYFVILKDFDMETGIRYIGSMIFLILLFIYAPKLKREEAYEKYIIRLFFNLFETLIYSGVLLFGIFAIIFTINTLFDANIDGKWYYYTFLIIYLMFAISLFLSKIPKAEEDCSKEDYSRSLKILLTYIVIPLISIYTVILYVYFIKILFLWEWPRGLVSHLVLWYSLISVGVIFFTTPLIAEERIVRLFKFLFPKIILPILAMMFISIGQRIMQYGFTENRYFVLILGVWVTGIMIYFSFKKPLRNIIIPISLSLIVLNAVYGPLSSINVSKISQNNRFEKILEKNNMIDDGNIVKNNDIDKNDKKEINNILTYFDNTHKLSDIRLLDDGFKTGDTESVFGFKFAYYNEYQEEKRFYYGQEDTNTSIDIKGYDYLVKMNSWFEKSIEIDDLNFKMVNKENIVIRKQNKELISIDLVNIVEENYETIKEFNKGFEENETKEMTPYYFENENIKGEIRLRSIGGEVSTSGEIIIEDIDLLMFINYKE